jgi:hypothetical protein
MSLLDHWINILATLIEFGGGLLVVFGCTRARQRPGRRDECARDRVGGWARATAGG